MFLEVSLSWVLALRGFYSEEGVSVCQRVPSSFSRALLRNIMFPGFHALGKAPRKHRESGLGQRSGFRGLRLLESCACLSISSLNPVKTGLGNDLASILNEPTGSKGGCQSGSLPVTSGPIRATWRGAFHKG